jgi:tetratricopeptide (TPR) repeat protein
MLASAIALATWPAPAASDDLWNCRNDVAACTRLINDRASPMNVRAFAYTMRASFLQASKDLDRALADQNESIRLDPKEAHSYYARGTIYRDKGELRRAIEDYNRSLELKRDPLVLSFRGIAWFGLGEFDRAIADFTENLKATPGNELSLGFRCRARAATGRDLPVALADCNEAIRKNANAMESWISRGLAYLQLRRFDDAIADYNMVLKVRPQDAAAIYGRGIAKLRKGDAGGNAEIAAAKAIKAGIAGEFARFGVKP